MYESARFSTLFTQSDAITTTPLPSALETGWAAHQKYKSSQGDNGSLTEALYDARCSVG